MDKDHRETKGESMKKDEIATQEINQGNSEVSSSEAVVSGALKLWEYIEKLGEDGVNIRCTGRLWIIGDQLNLRTEGTGESLLQAVHELPEHS